MSAAAGSAIYSRLSGDATLTALGVTGIYYGIAPAGAAAPYVTIQQVDGEDARVFGARAHSRLTFHVKGWDEGPSHLRAKQIAERCDALLDEYALSVGGTAVMSCRRGAILPDLTEVTNGIQYRQAGGLYDIEVNS